MFESRETVVPDLDGTLPGRPPRARGPWVGKTALLECAVEAAKGFHIVPTSGVEDEVELELRSATATLFSARNVEWQRSRSRGRERLREAVRTLIDSAS